MAKREIDEQELLQLQRGFALLEQLQGDPKARSHLERAVKVKYPDIKTQEEQIEEVSAPHVARVNEAVEALNKRMADLDAREQKAAEDAADNALLSSFQRLQSQGYTNEGISQIARLMSDRKIADPEAAAALYDRMNPRQVEAPPSAWEPQHWNIESNAVVDTKALFTDPDKWADAEVGKVLADVRGQRAA